MTRYIISSSQTGTRKNYNVHHFFRAAMAILFSFTFCLLSSQVPQGFNYQAIARDGTGQIIAGQSLPVRITIQTSIDGGTTIWEEEHLSVMSNQFGQISLIIGNGTRKSGVEKFTDIDWNAQPLFIKTTIRYPGSNWTVLGTTQLWSVPYSLVAKDLEGPVSKLEVAGTTSDMEEPLFEVRNKSGQTVFAVFNEGVRIYVSDGSKGAKGGFAVGGFGLGKQESQKYLYVDADSIRAYIDDEYTGKAAKGGFAVGGFGLAKGTGNNFMHIKPDSTNFYVREITPVYSSSFNIIGTNLARVRKSLMMARTDTIGISGVLNLQNDLIVAGNLNVSGAITKDTTKITDIDGNIYNTVKIGTQIWMAENLKVIHLNDGTGIPLVTDAATWNNLPTPGYCWYNNNESTYRDTYGALYNWYTAKTGKLCPSGWHIPSDAEWTILTNYLGGLSVAGGKMKEAGTAHWLSPNTGATNESGFTGLPAGYRDKTTGSFLNIGSYALWWSSTEIISTDSWGRGLYHLDATVYRYNYYNNHGFSVRCVKN